MSLKHWTLSNKYFVYLTPLRKMVVSSVTQVSKFSISQEVVLKTMASCLFNILGGIWGSPPIQYLHTVPWNVFLWDVTLKIFAISCPEIIFLRTC